MEEVKVSICCITYNQEKYISEALNSFLKQKTNFKVEIIVHDDASTDGTADIIRQFEKDYPDIIVPIFQKDNQYKEGKRILPILIEKARGEYIATCEGDDFWSANDKLQQQIDFLDSNKNYSACVHNTTLYNLRDNTKTLLNTFDTNSCNMDVARVLAWEDYFCFHLSSIVARRDIIKELPDFYYNTKGFGDYPLALYLAFQGPIHYINKEMSVYRKYADGSWSNRCASDINRRITHKKSLINMYKEFNCYTNFKYKKIIKKCIEKQILQLVLLQKENKEVIEVNVLFSSYFIRLRNKIIRMINRVIDI